MNDNYKRFVSIKDAHKYSFCNKEMLEKDSKCGCFYCLKIFKPKEITEYIEEDNGGKTALCPYCKIDSVIGDKSSGYPITKEFLSDMEDYWFEQHITEKMENEINNVTDEEIMDKLIYQMATAMEVSVELVIKLYKKGELTIDDFKNLKKYIMLYEK